MLFELKKKIAIENSKALIPDIIADDDDDVKEAMLDDYQEELDSEDEDLKKLADSIPEYDEEEESKKQIEELAESVFGIY